MVSLKIVRVSSVSVAAQHLKRHLFSFWSGEQASKVFYELFFGRVSMTQSKFQVQVSNLNFKIKILRSRYPLEEGEAITEDPRGRSEARGSRQIE